MVVDKVREIHPPLFGFETNSVNGDRYRCKHGSSSEGKAAKARAHSNVQRAAAYIPGVGSIVGACRLVKSVKQYRGRNGPKMPTCQAVEEKYLRKRIFRSSVESVSLGLLFFIPDLAATSFRQISNFFRVRAEKNISKPMKQRKAKVKKQKAPKDNKAPTGKMPSLISRAGSAFSTISRPIGNGLATVINKVDGVGFFKKADPVFNKLNSMGPDLF